MKNYMNKLSRFLHRTKKLRVRSTSEGKSNHISISKQSRP